MHGRVKACEAKWLCMPAEDLDVLDCSQASQRTSMQPPGPAGFFEDCAGPRKRLTRMPSPPCARNMFIDGPEEDATTVSSMHRRPPFVSRFRCSWHAARNPECLHLHICLKYDGALVCCMC